MSDSDLEGLLTVQDLDLALDQHRHRRETLPEAAEIQALDREAAGLRAEIQAVTDARDQIAVRQEAAENELAATETRSKQVSGRLYGGEVSASRELQAMSADLESLKVRASALEDQILELIEEREPFDARLAEMTARGHQMAARRAELEAAVARLQTEIDGQIAELVDRRQAAAANVSGALLATYEKIRPRLGGIGAARLIGNHCDGCHLVLSAVELDHVRHLPDGEVATCEQCSRILVPTTRAS
jgi:predicted  nucleic acid-binding Zn-ribbon protein